MLGVRLRGFPAWFAARTYHLAMMPGMARRVRLAADWTVGLFFGRASAELGQLGHPPSLGTYLDEARSRRGRRSVSELTFREGRASDLQAVLRARRDGAGTRRARERGLLPPRTSAHRGPELRERLERTSGRCSSSSPAQPGGCFSVCEDGRRDRGLRASWPASARWTSWRSCGWRPSHTGAGRGHGAARALLARARRRRELGRLVVAVGTPADLTLYTRVRRDAGERPLAHAPPSGPLPRAARSLEVATPPSPPCTCSRRTAPWRSGSGSSRLPSGTSARRCTSSSAARATASPPSIDVGRARRGALLGEHRRRDRPGRRAARPRTWSRSCWPRSTGWRRCRSRRASASYCTTDSWWLLDRLRRLGLQGALAELGDVVGPAARARPLPAHASRATALSTA